VLVVGGSCDALNDSGAVSLPPAHSLTPLGKALAALPVEVGVGKMLILGALFGKLEEALVLAALASVQSIFRCVVCDEWKRVGTALFDLTWSLLLGLFACCCRVLALRCAVLCSVLSSSLLLTNGVHGRCPKGRRARTMPQSYWLDAALIRRMVTHSQC